MDLGFLVAVLTSHEEGRRGFRGCLGVEEILARVVCVYILRTV